MPETVWLVWEFVPHEGSELHGIFRDQEQAESYAEHLALTDRYVNAEDLYVEEREFSDL